MKRTLRFVTGYVVGGTLFLIIIPLGFYELSKLDYLFDYKMLIGSMAVRLAVSGVLLLVGAVFMVWSNINLFVIGKGGPADAMGVAISPRTQKLVTQGPYKLCRHPMVFGAFTMYFSLVIYLNSVFGMIFLLMFLMLAVFFLRQTEEKRLLKDFGNEYVEYRKKVPMIIPIKRISRPS